VLAEAASRRFMAPAGDREFETEGDHSDLAGDPEHVLLFIECPAAAAEGIDPILDRAIWEYCAMSRGDAPPRVIREKRVGIVQ
jgi:hypothetical protein